MAIRARRARVCVFARICAAVASAPGPTGLVAATSAPGPTDTIDAAGLQTMIRTAVKKEQLSSLTEILKVTPAGPKVVGYTGVRSHDGCLVRRFSS